MVLLVGDMAEWKTEAPPLCDMELLHCCPVGQGLRERPKRRNKVRKRHVKKRKFASDRESVGNQNGVLVEARAAAMARGPEQ